LADPGLGFADWELSPQPRTLLLIGGKKGLSSRTFVKIAVRVGELKGKIKLAFPGSYP